MPNAFEWMQRLDTWQNGGWAGPLCVTLFPTNRCNLRCHICWQREFTVDKGELSEERLLRLVDECADVGVREWLIVGGGEPMVRGDTVTAVAKRIRERGMNGGIWTNGTLLQEKHLETLIEVGFDKIVVSLDGPTAEINDQIRSAGAFDAAMKKVRLLTEMKKARGACRPVLGFNVTLTRLMVDKIEDVLALADDVGCDGFVDFSSLIVLGENTKEYALSDQERQRLTANVSAILAKPWNHAYQSNLCNFAGGQQASGLTKTTSKRPGLCSALCFEPWLGVSILPDGRIGPCCGMWAPNLDSLADASFEETWRGPYMESVREMMSRGDAPDYCKNCPSGLAQKAVTQTQAFRERDQWQRAGLVGKAALLSKKAYHSFRRHGAGQLARRGLQWLQINAKH